MSKGFVREDSENAERGPKNQICEAKACIDQATQRIGGTHLCDFHAKAMRAGVPSRG